jgi:hypothetical protein
MITADRIRDNIIEKLRTITDEAFLTDLFAIIDNKAISNEPKKLSKEQILMLEMSEKDIELGRFIAQEELDRADIEWLKGL